ncbi:MAG: SIS domain-containing protein [Candidatus Liptonbacteria bacterium]
MEKYINDFIKNAETALKNIPVKEVAKALNIIQAAYERDGRIYVFGNGGSMAIATHWVGDFNKTVFDHHLDERSRRFQAIRLPSTEAEITAWANDVGFDMVFAGPLSNYLQDSDVVIAISSSGNSANVIKAVELAKEKKVPVIGLSGFDGGKLNELADAKILVPTEKGNYFIVEGIHGVILHLVIKYFKDYFNHSVEMRRKKNDAK